MANKITALTCALTIAAASAFAADASTPEKEINSLSDIQVASDVLSKFSASASVGYESEFIFRGKQLAGSVVCPEVDIAYDINFRTVRFETNKQINAFGGENGVMNTLKRENMNMLMIGTVKNDLLGALESAVQNTDGSFKVYNVASGSAYTIFMLAEERFWGFTDVAPISVGNGIEAYTINVMW